MQASSENATEQTVDVCPVSGPATISPVEAFQTQIVLSEVPETTWWLSGENATQLSWKDLGMLTIWI